jgi:RNA polymerase sigma factor (sigma-70 family)
MADGNSNMYKKGRKKVLRKKNKLILESASVKITIFAAEQFYLTETKSYTEPELVAGLKQKENAAFHYLYLSYRSALYNIILQIIPEKETASDVLQEVFITIWQQVEKYDDSKGRLFTWLMKVTRNAAINKLRSKLYKSQAKNESLEIYVNSSSVFQPESNNINLIGLRQQVHQLRNEYKSVIELSYYNGFTQEEIATALDIPLGTVKTRLRNALLELRKQFV